MFFWTYLLLNMISGIRDKTAWTVGIRPSDGERANHFLAKIRWSQISTKVLGKRPAGFVLVGTKDNLNSQAVVA